MEELALPTVGYKTYIRTFLTFCFPARGQPEGQDGRGSGWGGGGFFPPLSSELLPSRTLCQTPSDLSKKHLFCLRQPLRREDRRSEHK